MKKSISLFVVTCLLTLFASSSAYAIKKCKDAAGKWHYGDNAVRSCENSKVTTLTDRGFVKSHKSAPKTEQELEAEKDAVRVAEIEADRVKAEEDERNRILSVYETEADIDRQRDNQLGAVETNILIHKAYLRDMNAKIIRTNEALTSARGSRRKNLEAVVASSNAEIIEYSENLENLIEQKKQISQKFATEKKVYHSLRGS